MDIQVRGVFLGLEKDILASGPGFWCGRRWWLGHFMVKQVKIRCFILVNPNSYLRHLYATT